MAFGKTQLEHGKEWFEYSMLFGERLRTPRISFSDLASHNHFVLQHDATLNNSHAPVIIPSGSVSEDVLYGLLGLLNSSVACFWLKQVFKPKSSASKEIDKAGFAPENDRYEFGTTSLKKFPVPAAYDDPRLIKFARELTSAGRERESIAPAVLLQDESNLSSASALARALGNAADLDDALFGRLVFLQEELDWLVYELYGLTSYVAAPEIDDLGPALRPCAALAREDVLDQAVYRDRWNLIQATPSLRLLETAMYKRQWRGRQGVFGRYDRTYQEKSRTALVAWLANRVERALAAKNRLFSVEQLCADIQDDVQVQVVCEVLTGRRDFDLASLCNGILTEMAMPNHRFHIYTDSGLAVHSAWARLWSEESSEPASPQEYRSVDFLDAMFWRIRGRWDVPSERCVRLDEVPRDFCSPLYMWSGWSPIARIKLFLKLDEELEDAGFSSAQRIGLLDSAWQLLRGAAEEDAAAATRLKAELQALVGPEGPSTALIEDWKQRFPPPTARAASTKGSAPKAAKKGSKKRAEPSEEEDVNLETDDA